MSEHLVNKHVQIFNDNISAVVYLNHMAGPSTELSTLAQSLLAVCYELNVTVTAKYLAGEFKPGCRLSQSSFAKLRMAAQSETVQVSRPNIWSPQC